MRKTNHPHNNLLNKRHFIRIRLIPLGSFSISVATSTTLRGVMFKKSPLLPSSLEQAHQSRDALVNHLSHDLHTPMNGIIGMLDLLMATDLNPTQREFLVMAHASAENLLRRINNMLDFSRIESGQLRMEQVAFNLLQEIKDIVSAQSAAAARKGLELRVQYPAATQHHLIGNPLRIRQVVLSLIRLVIQLSTRGLVLLEVKTLERGALSSLTITVTGNGVTLSADQLDDIFYESNPANVPTSSRYAEAELGPATCKQLITLMGGKVIIKKLPGDAVALSFSLDLPHAPSASDVLNAHLTGTIRLLFVSEDLVYRRALELQLSQKGLQAEGYGSATDALTALETAASINAPYHIVILEHRMHGMDGETLGSALKADNAYKDILLILMTPETDNNQLQRFAELGFSACISTPLLQQQILFDTVEALCAALKSGKTSPFLSNATLSSIAATDNVTLSFAGYRVLVADDNLINRQVAVHILEQLGCRVDAAVNGREAVTLQALSPYDLILMDCQMPEMDGYQATLAIRAAAKTSGGRHTPIIALTAYAMQGEREKCMAVGMDDFLSKPLRPNGMREALGRWLRPSAAILVEDDDELYVMQKMFGRDFSELAALFLSDSPKRIALMEQAIADSNTEGLAQAAHSLSGSCSSIGATGLAALCKNLETKIKNGQSDNFQTKIVAIKTEYARVDTKLQAMMHSTNAAIPQERF